MNEKVLSELRTFFAAGETRSIPFRLAALAKLDEFLAANEEEFLKALETDFGKPRLESYMSEFLFLRQEIKLVRKNLRKWLRPKRASNPPYFWPMRSRIERQPFGVVLIFSPWNYPLQLALSPLIAAVAAGNTVLLKPSELTPASEAFLVRLISEVFPPGWVNTVTGDGSVASRLLEEEFDFIFFTGSTENGRKVAEAAAKNLTPTLLELGGKCPVIVDETADPEITARRIWVGKLFNAGQTCLAPDFVAVHEKLRDPLLAALEKTLADAPWEKEMARIVNERHYERLSAYPTDNLVLQKGEDSPADRHFAPRLVHVEDRQHPLLKEEIFGPILPVITYKDGEDFRETLTPLGKPLVTYAFSKDEDFFKRLKSTFATGSFCFNDTIKQAANLKLPFGGVGASGHGRYRGRYGVESLSYTCPVSKRYFLPDPVDMVPPKEERFETLRKWLK
ncbi:MAG: aldehyde dehydrogenase family protein [Verrucomicrobiota bacterium JB023]|nr:aldehyde dehydrogenase family protein [Verrucomicrobiota bacterium JB023]